MLSLILHIQIQLVTCQVSKSHNRAIKNHEKQNRYFIFKLISRTVALSVGGVMVSIDAFQALDPGSIPGHRTFFPDYL